MDDYEFDDAVESIVDNGGLEENPEECRGPVACVAETMRDFELLSCETGQLKIRVI